jgi:hypothetical protein
VAWALQQQGLAPAGLIADSGVLNHAWELAQIDQGLCSGPDAATGLTEVEKRLHPDLRVEGNQPHVLVADGRLTVPVMQVWDRGDTGQCGETPMLHVWVKPNDCGPFAGTDFGHMTGSCVEDFDS